MTTNIKKLLLLILLISVVIACISDKEKNHGKEQVATLVLIDESGQENDNSQPNNMVYIPAGKYYMGSNDSQANPDESPKHQVEVGNFYMDIHEVTNRQFKEFVEETEYITVAERPVDWDESYCLFFKTNC